MLCCGSSQRDIVASVNCTFWAKHFVRLRGFGEWDFVALVRESLWLSWGRLCHVSERDFVASVTGTKYFFSEMSRSISWHQRIRHCDMTETLWHQQSRLRGINKRDCGSCEWDTGVIDWVIVISSSESLWPYWWSIVHWALWHSEQGLCATASDASWGAGNASALSRLTVLEFDNMSAHTSTNNVNFQIKKVRGTPS